MLHKALNDYLKKIEQAIEQCSNIYVERYIEELLSSERANLRIRIRFNHGYLLEINEAFIVSDNNIVFLDYRYHCQDKQNNLIFRYDSTPHFPDLSSFPHHKHLPGKVIKSDKPDIEYVIREIMEMEIIKKDKTL